MATASVRAADRRVRFMAMRHCRAVYAAGVSDGDGDKNDDPTDHRRRPG
jgi:hypothetical protein